MTLRRVFEGQYDRVFGNEAANVWKNFSRELRRDPDIPDATFRSVKVERGVSAALPGDLSVEINFRPGANKIQGEFAPYKSGGAGRIKFDVSIDVNEPGFDTLTWVQENPEALRSEFIHEFIHYLDWKRMGHEQWRSAAGKRREMEKQQPTEAGRFRKYHQDPLEQNAFFQMVADQMVREVTPEVAARTSINDFYRLFVKRMGEFADMSPSLYRERQIPHLKKRVAQLYQDIIASG